jgi:hypothetical protein
VRGTERRGREGERGREREREGERGRERERGREMIEKSHFYDARFMTKNAHEITRIFYTKRSWIIICSC